MGDLASSFSAKQQEMRDSMRNLLQQNMQRVDKRLQELEGELLRNCKSLALTEKLLEDTSHMGKKLHEEHEITKVKLRETQSGVYQLTQRSELLDKTLKSATKALAATQKAFQVAQRQLIA